MAADPQAVERLVQILKDMGYNVGPGHEVGKVDAGFRAAFDPALKDLIRIGTGSDTAAFTPEIAAQLLTTIQQKKADADKMGALEAYSRGEGYYEWLPVKGKTHAQLREALIQEGFRDRLLEPRNVAGVVKFFAQAETTIADISTVMADIGAAANLTAQQQQEQDRLRREQQQRQDQQLQQQQQQQQQQQLQQQEQERERLRLQQQRERVTAEIKDLQKDFLGYSEAEATGEINAAFQEKFRTHVKKLQEEATGWTGNKDGVYTDQFHTFLNASTNPQHVAFVAAMSELKATGAPLAVLTAPPAPPPPAPGANAPPAGAPAAGAQPPVVVPPTPGNLGEQANYVERILIELGAAINGRVATAKEKGGLISGLLFEFSEIPVLTTADRTFDRQSREALQAVMKAMQKQLELTDEEIYNYTPAVGQKIIRAYPKLERSLTAEQKQKLGGIDGVRGLVIALDALHAAGQLPGEKVYEGQPFKLTGMGISILQWIFNFIGGMFPQAQGLMDTLLKQFTGGYGYRDLMPADRQDQRVIEQERRYAHLPTEDRLKQQFIDSLQEARALGKTDEQLRDRIMTGVGVMMQLSPDQASAQAYKDAVEKAFEEAKKQTGLDNQAAAFAQTFRNTWNPAPAAPAPAPGGAPAPAAGRGAGSTNQPPAYTIDESIRDFKPEGGGTVDRMIATLEKLAQAVELRDRSKEPIVFKHTDGATYVMGVTTNNVITIRKMTPELVADLDKTVRDMEAAPDQAARDAIRADFQSRHQNDALGLLNGAYAPYFTLPQLRDMLRPDKVLTFPEVERNTNTFHANMMAFERQQNEIHHRAQAQAQQRWERVGRGAGEPAPVMHGRERGQPAYGEAQFGEQRPLNYNFAADGAAMMQQIDRRLAARSSPVVIPEDFTGRGRLRVIYSDDYNGVQSIIDRTGSINRALSAEGDKFFKTADLTDEYRRFMAEYNDFCKKNERQMQGWGESDRFKEFKRHLEFERVDLVGRYPGMAAVIFNSRDGMQGANYRRFYHGNGTSAQGADIVEFAWSLRGQVAHLDESKFNGQPYVPHEQQGDGPRILRGLRRIFGGHSRNDGEHESSDGDGNRRRDSRRPIPEAPNSPEYQALEDRVRREASTGAEALERSRPADIMQGAGAGLTTREGRLGGSDADPRAPVVEDVVIPPGGSSPGGAAQRR